MWGDESEAVAPIIWLYQIVDAQKEEVFFPDLLITLRSYVWKMKNFVAEIGDCYCLPSWILKIVLKSELLVTTF